MKKFTRVFALALVCVMALALLVACAPNSDSEKAAAALKKNGYVATRLTDFVSLGFVETALGATRGDLVAIVSGTKKDDDGNFQTVTIWYFKDASTAGKLWKKAQEEAESNKDKDSSDWTVARSGAMIYFGTKAGIKAAK